MSIRRDHPQLPSTWRQLGHELAKRRESDRHMTQRQVQMASQGAISKSSLQRYEQGAPVPADKAAVLDAIYDYDGWVTAAVARLAAAELAAVDRRWRPGTAQTFFVHRWPAAFSGWVWIGIWPSAGAADQPHVLTLQWGPWRRQLREPLPASGLALHTGKGTDVAGQAAPCHVASDRKVSVLFGVHDPPPELRTIDIREGWV